MPCKKCIVNLTAEERVRLKNMISSGQESARKLTRAPILLKAGQLPPPEVVAWNDAPERRDPTGLAKTINPGRRAPASFESNRALVHPTSILSVRLSSRRRLVEGCGQQSKKGFYQNTHSTGRTFFLDHCQRQWLPLE
jgi:hypothetical protein